MAAVGTTIAITIQEHPFMAGFKGVIAKHKAH
jgi:hypothetical protein